MAKSLLIVSRQAPWSGPSAREALDIALTGGAFELPIALLFLDDGVFQLVSGQQPDQLQLKDLGANLQALPLFGIDALFVSQSSLDLRGLQSQDLAQQLSSLNDAEVRELIERYDQVITI